MELPAISVLNTRALQIGSEGVQVIYEPRLSGIVVAGPKAAIDSIRSNAVEQPYAEFTVVFDNPNTRHNAPLRFPNLPPGVRVLENAGKPHTIDYTLETKPN